MDSLYQLIKDIEEPAFSNTKKELLKRITPRSVKKGEVLHFKGNISRSGYRVLRGLLRSYSIDEKGKEHTFMFAPETWFIGDLESEIFNTPSRLFVEAMEDSEIEEISSDIITFFPHFPPSVILNEFQRLKKRSAILQKRVILLMSASARERYQDFINTYPDIHNRVPLKMIASYLGITPEALSTIRRKLSSNSKYIS